MVKPRSDEALLLAIDAGTDSVRATLLTPDADVVGIARRACHVRVGPQGEAEQDPVALWQALCECTSEIAANEGAKLRIKGIGITAALGLVVVDSSARPLRPIMTWQDKRATAEADALSCGGGRNGLFARSGRPIDPELAACKLMWLRRHEPAVFARIETAYTLKDWIVHRFTGERVTDPTSASYSMLFNVFRRTWDDSLIANAGVLPQWNPEVRPADAVAGKITTTASRETGLPVGIPVAVGGPDGTMGALGAGLLESGSAVDVIGTTDVVFAVATGPVEDLSRRTITNAFIADQKWAVGGPLGLTGGALRWFAEAFGPLTAKDGSTGFAALDALAADVRPGADGLLFFPGLAGDRAPRWNPAARGVLLGLSTAHERAHVARAILEGCAFAVADTLDAIGATGVAVREIRAAGGGAASDTWLQIRANALGRPLLVPEVIEASSLGAAIAAGVATGIYATLAEGIGRTVRIARVVEPDLRIHRLYRELRAIMSELYPKLDPMFPALQRAISAFNHA